MQTYTVTLTAPQLTMHGPVVAPSPDAAIDAARQAWGAGPLDAEWRAVPVALSTLVQNVR